MTIGWSAFTINKGDLKKAKAAGFLSDSMECAIPDGEVVPHPAEGFQVMFLSFLYHGHSLHAHEILCRLLFVYGM
jgi:hypothetical protein